MCWNADDGKQIVGNGINGFNLLDGKVRRIARRSLKSTPHGLESSTAATPQAMAWHRRQQSVLLCSQLLCDSSLDAIGTTCHGSEFISALAKKNIFAVQFHPEKSQKVGINFIKILLIGKVIDDNNSSNRY